jgi:oligosaccharide reducing-end xylanase
VLRRRPRLLAALTALCVGASACVRTVDSLGDDGARDAAFGDGARVSDGRSLDEASMPPDGGIVYPNPFGDMLGKTGDDVAVKIGSAFRQLFHGDQATESVYHAVGVDEGYVEDVFNDVFNIVRAESMGYALMITLQLDKKEEFDRLWTWTKTFLQIAGGPIGNTFRDSCMVSGMNCSPLPDPYGSSYIAMSLVFASHRWTNGPNIYDYESEAQRVLASLPSLFDFTQGLSVNGAMPPQSLHATPANQVPAFAELWEKETGNTFWRSAAASGRGFWRITTNPMTGLAPGSADFNGAPVAGFETFGILSYALAMDITTDHVWFGADAWQITEANRLIDFFTGQGLTQYVDRYSLDGTPMGTAHPTSLVAMNGVMALTANSSARVPLVQAVWDLPIPAGPSRFSDAMFYLLSLLTLSGNFRMY